MINRVKLLDHGYLKFVEKWGSEKRIIEAARMSTDKGFLGWGLLKCSCGAVSHTSRSTSTSVDIGGQLLFKDKKDSSCPTERGGAHVALPSNRAGDEKLMRYLWENKHATPFEFAGTIIEVQAPICVYREWHRHRTQSFNEMSGRYTPLPNFNYIPTVERLMFNSKGSNKQAGTISGAEELTRTGAILFRKELKVMYAEQEDMYQRALKRGIPKELARIHLPVGRYSRMRASANLRNWLGFLTLRQDPAAQYEIRVYANAMANILSNRFPRVMEMFSEQR